MLHTDGLGSVVVKLFGTHAVVDAFFIQALADAKGALQSWHDEAIKANWETPQDIKEQYRSASICGNSRVVFNVAGNKYRLVVEMQYQAGIMWVKFVGTHAQYDKINVETVNE